MAYIPDNNLEFLAKASHEDLKLLADILMKDPNDGETRWTQELSLTFQKCTDYTPYWNEIAGELQCFGANTIATLFRGGKGVCYREILMDVCDNIKVNYNKNSDIQTIERHFLARILEKAWDKMDHGERKEFIRTIREHLPITELNRIKITTALNINALMEFVLLCNKLSLLKIGTLISTFVIPKTIGTISGVLAPAVLGRFVGVPFGPIGWLIGAGSLLTLASPAYRVTIPACVIVSVLRQKIELKEQDELEERHEEFMPDQKDFDSGVVCPVCGSSQKKFIALTQEDREIADVKELVFWGPQYVKCSQCESILQIGLIHLAPIVSILSEFPIKQSISNIYYFEKPIVFKRKCFTCGKYMADSAKFCTECGTKIASPYCSKCGYTKI